MIITSLLGKGIINTYDLNQEAPSQASAHKYIKGKYKIFWMQFA